jgi:hypothetical protein
MEVFATSNTSCALLFEDCDTDVAFLPSSCELADAEPAEDASNMSFRKLLAKLAMRDGLTDSGH